MKLNTPTVHALSRMWVVSYVKNLEIISSLLQDIELAVEGGLEVSLTLAVRSSSESIKGP